MIFIFYIFPQMMHVVPSCASPVPYFSPSYSPESPPDLTFEFDLNLLPSADCSDVVPGLDLPLPLPSDPFQEVPSPSSSLDSYLHSPTMFSPAGNEKTPLYSSYMMDPNSSSPISLPPSSPYSPGNWLSYNSLEHCSSRCAVEMFIYFISSSKNSCL